jgi:hypothetical protein
VTAFWRTPRRAQSVVADQGDRCRGALSSRESEPCR